MSHVDTRVELPPRGLVLVTGANGSGKSSLVEGVATAAFGKTLRGTSPWSGEGLVSIITEDLDIERTHTKGGGKKLRWEPVEGDDTQYENTTKSQEALESHIGSFDVWRRTSVFSSQDAAHFTMATDGQRKKLLEQLLGLNRFDPALSACRSDRKDAEAKLNEAVTLLSQLESQLEGTRERVADAQRVLETVPLAEDVTELRARQEKIDGMLPAISKEMDEIHRDVKRTERGNADLMAKAREVHRRLQALGEGDCDKCGQPIPEVLIQRLTDEVAAADGEVATAREKLDSTIEGFTSQLEELDEEHTALRDKRQALATTISQEERHAQQREAAQAAVDRAEGAVAALAERIEKGQGIVEEVRARRALLEAVEEVLGLKGVRAHVLGRALTGIERAANVWLNRIVGSDQEPPDVIDAAAEVEAMLGGPLCLTLKPYSEKKTGGISDSISLDIHGAGGGYGYKGASGGERRRIDVALLLALAEVAQVAHGMESGTLFIDEAMDALDEDGVVRVASVLEDMAKDQCVVLISHNEGLCQVVHPNLHLHVDRGTVSVV